MEQHLTFCCHAGRMVRSLAWRTGCLCCCGLYCAQCHCLCSGGAVLGSNGGLLVEGSQSDGLHCSSSHLGVPSSPGLWLPWATTWLRCALVPLIEVPELAAGGVLWLFRLAVCVRDVGGAEPRRVCGNHNWAGRNDVTGERCCRS